MTECVRFSTDYSRMPLPRRRRGCRHFFLRLGNASPPPPPPSPHSNETKQEKKSTERFILYDDEEEL